MSPTTAWAQIPARACEKVASGLELDSVVFCHNYSSFLYRLQMASHKFASICQKCDDNWNSKFQIWRCAHQGSSWLHLNLKLICHCFIWNLNLMLLVANLANAKQWKITETFAQVFSWLDTNMAGFRWFSNRESIHANCMSGGTL